MRQRAVAAAASAALVAGVAGCSGSTPGMTDKNVIVAAVQPETGADAPGWSEVAVGAAAYFKYVNARGGINGRTITYQVTDSASDPAKAASQWQHLADDDKVFAVLGPTGVAQATVPKPVTDAGLPVLFPPGCPCWAGTDGVVGFAPSWTVEGKVLGSYVAQHDKGKKVGYFTEAGPFGAAGVAGLDQEIPRGDVVARVTYDPTQPDVSHQVQQLKAAGADVIVSFARPAFTALLRLSLVADNYTPALVVSSTGSDPATEATILDGLGQKAGSTVNGLGLVQNLVTDTFLPPPTDTSNSWVKLFQEVHDQYIPQLPFDGNILEGMAMAYTFADALQLAGSDPSRGDVLDALGSAGITSPSLVPLGYADSIHVGATGAQIAIIRGTGLQLVGKPVTTDTGSGPVRPFSGKTQEPPLHGLPPSPTEQH
jgi:ABC-type branched-subunit amino acid transport system substrate-binding protein